MHRKRAYIQQRLSGHTPSHVSRAPRPGTRARGVRRHRGPRRAREAQARKNEPTELRRSGRSMPDNRQPSTPQTGRRAHEAHERHTGARPWPRKHDRRPSRSADPCSRRAPGPVLEEHVVTGSRGAHAKHRRGRMSPPSSAGPGGRCPTRARPRQPDALTRHTRHTGARPWSRKHDRRPSRSRPL